MSNLLDFLAPARSKDEIREMAEAFRAQHPGSGIPYDIEAVVEFDLGIAIVPQVGLQKETACLSWLSMDQRTIYVDRDLYLVKDGPAILRCAVAHEVGHLVVHSEVIPIFRAHTLEEWQEIQMTIPAEQYDILEKQALEFGGRLLVPLDGLKHELMEVIPRLKGCMVETLDPDPEQIRTQWCSLVGEKFQVPGEMIELRLESEAICLPPL